MALVRLLLCFLIIVSCLADAAPDYSKNSIQLGLSSLYFQPLYKGENHNSYILPVIDAQYQDLYFRGLELGYLLEQSHQQGVVLAVAADKFSVYDMPDSSRAKGKQDALNLKAGISRFYGNQILSASLATDFSQVHDGSQVEISWFYSWYAGSKIVYGGVYGYWYDHLLTEHYFSPESPSSYKPRDAWILAPAISLDVYASGRWQWQVGMMLEIYSPQVYQSPIVQGNKRLLSMLSIAHKF